jgi:KRAB domain-containing zinc finger protein
LSCIQSLKSANCTKEIFVKNQEILLNKPSNINVPVEQETEPENSHSKSGLPEDQKQATQKRISCAHCPKTFHSKRKIQKHLKNRHFQTNRVPISSSKEQPIKKPETKKLSRKSPEKPKKKALKNPRKPSAKVTCTVCGILIRSDNLRCHVLLKHEKIKKYFCHHCPCAFFFKREITVHLKKVHFKILDVPCSDCPLFFVSRAAMQNHYKYTHLGIRFNQDRMCPICGKISHSKANYDTHLRSNHTKLKPFKCNIEGCNRSYYDLPSLKKHQIDGHSELKTCTLCFKQIKNLKQHLLVSHRERKFLCDCGKKYVTKGALDNHIKLSHRMVRSFKCEICNSGYRSKPDLRAHQLSIHESRKIKCDVDLCNVICSTKNYYRRHVLSNHANLDPEIIQNLILKIKNSTEDVLFNFYK